MNGTHITWSVENAGHCPTCGSETVLVIAPASWQIDGEDEIAEICDEISGHYCKACSKLVSLSLNTEV